MSSDCFHLTNGLRDWKRCGAITICFEWFALSNIALHLIINLFLSSPIKPCSIQLKHPFWWNLHVNDMIIWHPKVEICKICHLKCTTMVGRCQGEATFWLIGASNPSLSFYNDIMGLECSLNVAVFAKWKHILKLKYQCCQVYVTKPAHSWPKLDQSY